MSKKFEIPKLHSKPNLMAAVAVYYASLITNDPIDFLFIESLISLSSSKVLSCTFINFPYDL